MNRRSIIFILLFTMLLSTIFSISACSNSELSVTEASIISKDKLNAADWKYLDSLSLPEKQEILSKRFEQHQATSKELAALNNISELELFRLQIEDVFRAIQNSIDRPFRIERNRKMEEDIYRPNPEKLANTSSEQLAPGTRIVAEAYSKRYGVTIDEALKRLELQDSFPGQETQLVDNESETFGGLWIQHEPQYKIVVAFTRDGEKTIAKYNDFIPAKIAPYIEIRTVGKSLIELSNEQLQLMESLRKLEIPADSMVDVMNNCVNIGITKENEAKLVTDQRLVKLVIPENTKINIVKGLITVD